MRERNKKKKKKKERVEWRTSPGRVPPKIGSKLPIPALLARAKLCLSSPFQGDPRGSGIDPVCSECTPVSPI